MPSSFGRKKPAVRESGRVLAWLPRVKDEDAKRQAAQEAQQAFYRITHTEPSRLERARMMRGRDKLSA